MTTSGDDGTGLLDRDRALHDVYALIAEAAARAEPVIVRVVGSAGIGKTAFLDEIARRATSLVLRSAAEPGDCDRPGATVRRLLGDEHGDALQEALAPALRAAIGAGCMLLVDDLQWVDEVSARMLRALFLSRDAPPVAIVAADRRDDAPELPSHRAVALVPLRAAAAERLARRGYAGAPQSVIAEIVDSAAGVPFSIEFLAAEAARDAARSAAEAQPSVRAAIAARLNRCSDGARETARLCALLEVAADVRLIARARGSDVAGISADLAELADLAAVRDMRVVFRHDAIAQAVRSGVIDAVPYHRRLLAAHDRARRLPEALSTLLHCARGCGDDAVATDAALGLARASAASGSLRTALEYAELAVRHAPRPLPLDVTLELGGVLQHLGRDEQAGDILRAELRDALERRDAPVAASILISYGSVALTLERFAEYDALIDRVGALAERDAALAAKVVTARIAAFAYSGRLDEFDAARVGVEIASLDQRFVAYAASLRGDPVAAQRAFATYGAALRSEHARQATPDDALAAAMGFFDLGNRVLIDCERRWSGSDVRETYVTSAAMRIVSRLNDGRWDEADAIIAALPLQDDEYDESYAILDARLFFTALAKRPVAAPDRTLTQLRTMIARRRTRHTVAATAWYWIACIEDNRDVPRDIIAFVTDAIGVAPMPYLLGGVPLYRALLADRIPQARAAEAVGKGSSFSSRWHRAHDDLAAGLMNSDPERLRRARDAFDALDAPVFAATAGLALPVPRAVDVAVAQQLGMTAGEAAADPARGRLTVRENAVAQLAAQGLSNTAIAQRLAIAERTVETHLTNVFRKLAVRSRAGLAHALLRRGFVEP